MKTSNKLLLGLMILVISLVTTVMVIARLGFDNNKYKGNGKKASIERNIGKFDKISLKGRFTVHLSQGENQRLKIDADENLIPLVQSSVDEGVLKINLKKKISNNDKIEIFITADTINSIDLAAGVSLNGEGEIKGNKLKVVSTAGSTANLKVAYNEVKGESHAGATLSLSGRTALATLIATAGSTILAEELVSKRGNVEAHAGATVQANVVEELEAEATSGSSISYQGNPNVKKSNSNSGASIHKQ